MQSPNSQRIAHIQHEQAAIDGGRKAINDGVRDWRLRVTGNHLRTIENLCLIAPSPLPMPLQLQLGAARKAFAKRARLLASRKEITINEIHFAPTDEAPDQASGEAISPASPVGVGRVGVATIQPEAV